MNTPVPQPRVNPKRTLTIFALIFLLTLPSLWAGLMGDDYLHYAIFNAKNLPIEKPDDLSLFGLFSFINGEPERNRQAMDLGVIPWWTYSGMKYAFWRPLSEITHWIDHQLWPRSPAMMHLHNVLWYLALCFLLLKLYKRTLATSGVALLAVAIYGIDSTHGFAVSWIANRNGLISATLGMAALYCHLRNREDGQITWLLASVSCMLGALLAAELGISTFGYLAAYALCCDPKGRIKGLLACAPHFAVIVTWWLIYKSAGFGAANADAYYVDPASHPWKFLELFFQRYPVLLASQWGIVPADLFGYGVIKGATFVWGCIIFLLIILPLIAAVCFRNPPVRMWFLGMLFSLVPATTALPQDRVLSFVGAGASAVLAHFLFVVFKEKKLTGSTRWASIALGGLMILLHLILSPLLLPVTSYSTKLLWSNLISQKPSELPDIPDIENKRIVIIGAPLASALAIAPFRFYRGEPVPKRIWLISSLDKDINIHKTSSTDVEMSLNEGFIQGPEIAVRDFTRFPFAPGDQIQLGGMKITVKNLNPLGMPTTLGLTFDHPIADMNVLFLRWEEQSKSYEEIEF